MTRENKLALIIGFGLILVVGILISDHLSAATRQESADLAGRAAEREERFVHADTLAPAEVDPRASQRPRIRIRETPLINGDPLGSDPGRRDGSPHESNQNQQVQPVIPDRTDSGQLREIRTPDLQSERFRPVEPEVRPITFQWYTIKSGESLSKIAERFYGESNLWRPLAEFNKDRIPNPDRVAAGITIRVPTKEALTGSTAGASAAQATPPQSQSPQQQPPARRTEYTKYTIQSGDNLGKIAQRFLGTSRRYLEIYELNKDVLSGPDDIRVGTTIRIPKSD